MILTTLNKAFLIIGGGSTFLLQPLIVLGYTIPVLQVIGASAIVLAIGFEFGWFIITVNRESKEEKKAKKLDKKIKSLGI